jgi:hypothetical protein
MEMTIENHGRGRSSQPEQLRPDGTLLTIKATPEERLCWDCATIGRVIVSNRPHAIMRLEAMLGDRLSHALLAELTVNSRQATSASYNDAA